MGYLRDLAMDILILFFAVSLGLSVTWIGMVLFFDWRSRSKGFYTCARCDGVRFVTYIDQGEIKRAPCESCHGLGEHRNR